ncbi:MAG: protein-L-isoaspartate O-methyltransferase [Candidatus Aenigmatarchaeota archaeon]|nr:MAG: protein-L-isoaspartate O-methyltransferase [Candidatus Aenigmarchaeota archaeon]
MDKDSLINELIKTKHLKTREVIQAFRKVKRENFVPLDLKRYAYVNEPLPIGYGQTISQPLTVADMTEALEPKRGQKILEIGTGSGYQAAILAEIVGKKGKIVTIEQVKELADFASKNLKYAGYANVKVIYGDGSLGYAKESPYERIIVTAASPDVPKPLKKQLKDGGIMIIPVGYGMQELMKIIKKGDTFEEHFLGWYRFVPLKGRYGFKI